MMSERKAMELAAAAGLQVSKTTTVCEAAGRKIHRLTVGRAACAYDTAVGGSACWRVALDGIEHHGGFKGEAIAKAVALQQSWPTWPNGQPVGAGG